MRKRQDWLVLALSVAGGEMSPVQIQKTMFLLKMEAPARVGPDFYDFLPYNYGPFCASIYDDLEHLASEGLVAIHDSPPRRWRSYLTTPRGLERNQELRADIDPVIVDFLDRLVAWVTSKSFSDLLRAIYAKYPRYKENSVFAD